MFRRLIFPKEVTDQEARRLAEPAALSTLILSGLLIISGLYTIFSGNGEFISILFGVSGILYSIALFYVVIPSQVRLQQFKWPIAVTNAIAVIIAVVFLPNELGFIARIILVLISAIMIILWGRAVTYTYILLALIFHIMFMSWGKNPLLATIQYFSFFLLAVIVVETIQRMHETNMNRINRLKVINEFSRQVSTSLDAQKVLTMVGAALQKAIDADTYFFGTVEEDHIHLHLIYDEGEFFPQKNANLEGTLSGWVIRNQQSLFIPDLRHDVDLEGVKLVLLGKDKTSLSWMGVPIKAEHVNGVIVVASYTPNNFNRTDLELLENLAQQGALALDNAYHHTEVQAQSRLDSLTGVYNHGYFVNILRQEAEDGHFDRMPLSLIMMDIDYFKQYNDNYGHVVGDQVLTLLAQAIRQHLKSADAIGRWGGEEFAIMLPDTNGTQALQVAKRIQEQ